jgi:hypothetical protein
MRTIRAERGSMRRKSAASVCRATSAIAPGHFDASRAAAYDHERKEALLLSIVLRQLGAFKRGQNFASYGGGVLDALKTGA